MDDERTRYDRDVDDAHLDDAPELSDDDYRTIERITAQQGDGADFVAAGDAQRRF